MPGAPTGERPTTTSSDAGPPVQYGSRAAGGAARGRSPAHRTACPAHHPGEGSCPTRTESLTSVTDASRRLCQLCAAVPTQPLLRQLRIARAAWPRHSQTPLSRAASHSRAASSDAADGNPRGSPQGGGALDAREGRKSGEGHPRAVAQTRCIGLPRVIPSSRCPHCMGGSAASGCLSTSLCSEKTWVNNVLWLTSTLDNGRSWLLALTRRTGASPALSPVPAQEARARIRLSGALSDPRSLDGCPRSADCPEHVAIARGIDDGIDHDRVFTNP